MNLSAGDTVNSTKSKVTTIGESFAMEKGSDPRVASTRKRRRLDPWTTNTEIPEKAQRREQEVRDDAHNLSSDSNSNHQRSSHLGRKSSHVDPSNVPFHPKTAAKARTKTIEHEGETRPRLQARLEKVQGRDEARLRKTIQWLEDGARRLREELANARTELHEERRAAKITRRLTDAAIREARAAEATKYQAIIAEIKASRGARGSQSEGMSPSCAGCMHACVQLSSCPGSNSTSFRPESLKDEQHRRQVSAVKKRLTESEETIRKLKWEALNTQPKVSCKAGTSCGEVRRLENELQILRTNNEKLEEKLRIALEAEKARTTELRIQHENHEAELSSLRKSLRTETIKMMDELRGKSREIEKLSKLGRVDASRKRRRTTPKHDLTMRKLRVNERVEAIQTTARSEKKLLLENGRTVEAEYSRAIREVEVERLRELALEQQEVIEILRQAVKEKERKLEQLSNRRRKEEFYRQWLELEPVAEEEEVEEEEEEEHDSAVSSGPSSLSPQPGGYQWQANVTREAYESVLVELEDLQTKLFNERHELSTAGAKIRDLEEAILQQTCDNRKMQANTLSDLSEKLRAAEEREATLLVEMSELREQNELLEFRLLELEETPGRRSSPDAADSGIVSPEPMHKEQSNNQRNRAVATVIPYTSHTIQHSDSPPVSPLPRKAPLSLQESGIFEQDDTDDVDYVDEVDDVEVECDQDNLNVIESVQLTNKETQTEVPAGELLQEVQRLQELRARIQERATKVPLPSPAFVCSVDQNRICSSLEAVSDTVDSIVQLSTCQERIRDLEERLGKYERQEEIQTMEKQVNKQREEELLDENYRLTEKVYWLENELKGIKGTDASSKQNTMETKRIDAGASDAREMINKDEQFDIDFDLETRNETQMKNCLNEEENASSGIVLNSTMAVQTSMNDPSTARLVPHDKTVDQPDEKHSVRRSSSETHRSILGVDQVVKETKEMEITEVEEYLIEGVSPASGASVVSFTESDPGSNSDSDMKDNTRLALLGVSK